MSQADPESASRTAGTAKKSVGKSNLMTLVALMVVALGLVLSAGWYLVVLPARNAAEQEAAARLRSTKGVLVIGRPKVESADFTSVAMTDQLVSDIALLANVKTLNLKGTGTTDSQLEAMMGRIDPVSIVLSGTAVTDEGLGVLHGLSRIEALFLRDTAVGDRAAETIGTLTTLAEIDFTNTQITSAGLDKLVGLKSLKRLILDGTAVDDQGLAALKPLKNLARLEVRDTAVTAAGVSDLGQSVSGLVIEQ